MGRFQFARPDVPQHDVILDRVPAGSHADLGPGDLGVVERNREELELVVTDLDLERAGPLRPLAIGTLQHRIHASSPSHAYGRAPFGLTKSRKRPMIPNQSVMRLYLMGLKL